MVCKNLWDSSARLVRPPLPSIRIVNSNGKACVIHGRTSRASLPAKWEFTRMEFSFFKSVTRDSVTRKIDTLTLGGVYFYCCPDIQAGPPLTSRDARLVRPPLPSISHRNGNGKARVNHGRTSRASLPAKWEFARMEFSFFKSVTCDT